MAKREYVFYSGKKYAKDKRGYWRSTTRPHEGLHTVIWEEAHGEIPEGCEVHHIDLDPSNNQLENLQCLTKEAHRKLHADMRRGTMIEPTEQSVCIQCGKTFASVKKNRKYCSDKCKQAWLTAHGRFNNRVVRVCERCGKEFETSKYDATRFCSTRCANTTTNEARAKLKPDDVRYIRLNPDRLSYSQLAKKFSVTKSTIYRVIKRIMYPDID